MTQAAAPENQAVTVAPISWGERAEVRRFARELDESNELARRAAAKALGLLMLDIADETEASSALPLIQKAALDPNGSVRRALTGSLRHLYSEDAREVYHSLSGALMAALKDENRERRQAAAVSLGMFNAIVPVNERAEHLEMMSQVFRDSPPAIQMELAATMAKEIRNWWGGPSNDVPASVSAAIPMIVSLLDHTEGSLRLGAALSVADLAQGLNRPDLAGMTLELVSAAMDPTNALEVRREALNIVGPLLSRPPWRTNTAEFLPRFLELTQDGDAEVRRNAARDLRGLAPDDADMARTVFLTFSNLLHSANLSVKLLGAESFPPDSLLGLALEAAREGCANTDPSLRMRSADTLLVLSSRMVNGRDPSPSMTAVALSVPATVALCFKLVIDPEPEIRQVALLALSRILGAGGSYPSSFDKQGAGHQALIAATRLLKDPYPQVSEAARSILSLSWLVRGLPPDDRRVVLEALLEVIQMAGPRERSRWLGTLSMLDYDLYSQPEEQVLVFERIRPWIDDPHAETRERAFQVLGNFASMTRLDSMRNESLTLVLEKCGDDQDAMRQAAFESLRRFRFEQLARKDRESFDAVCDVVLRGFIDVQPDIRRAAILAAKNLVPLVESKALRQGMTAHILAAAKEGDIEARRPLVSGLLAMSRNQPEEAETIQRALLACLADPEPSLRVEALRGLDGLDTDEFSEPILREALPLLLELIQSDDPRSRSGAAATLGGSTMYGVSPFVTRLTETNLQHQMLEGLRAGLAQAASGSERVTMAVALGIAAGAFEDAEAFQFSLESLAAQIRIEEAARLWTESLKRLPNRPGFESLRTLGEQGREQRTGAVAANALVMLPGFAASEALRHRGMAMLQELAGDPEPAVRIELARGYTRMGYTPQRIRSGAAHIPWKDPLLAAMKALVLAALGDSELEVRLSAVNTMRKFSWEGPELETVLPQLLRVVNDREPTVGSGAASALVWFAEQIYRSKPAQNDLAETLIPEVAKHVESEDSGVAVPLFNALGVLQTTLGNREEAVAAYRRAMNLEREAPSDRSRTAASRLGDLLAAMERYEEAIEAYQRAAELDPNNDRTWRERLAAMHAKLGHQAEVVAVLGDADDPNALSERLRFFQRQGDLTNLLAAGERLLTPSTPDAYAGTAVQTLVDSFARGNQLDMLVNHFEARLETNAQDVAAMRLLVRAYRQQNRTKDIISLCERIVAIAPHEADAWRTLAHEYGRANAEKAIAAFRRVIELEGDLSDLTGLAELYGRLRRPAEAAKLIEESRPALERMRLRSSAGYAESLWSRMHTAADQHDAATQIYLQAVNLSPQYGQSLWLRQHASRLSPAGAEQVLPWLTHTNPAVRAAAVGVLREQNDPRFVEAMELAAKDPQPRVRLAALEALKAVYKRRDQPDQVSGLAAREIDSLLEATKDEDRQTRLNAIGALGNLRDARVFPVLMEALESSESMVRSAAAQGLGRQKMTNAIPALVQLLQDPESFVQANAAEALIRIGMADLNPLRALLDAELRHPLVWAGLVMSETDPTRARTWIEEARATDKIIAALTDSHAEVRGAAARVLGHLGAAAAVEPLSKLFGDERTDVQRHAMEAVAEIGNEHAVTVLGALLQDPNFIRQHYELVGLLSRIESPSVESFLLRAADESDHSIRDVAVFSLARRQSVKAIKPLLRLLREEHQPNVEQQIVRDLVALGSPALEELITFVRTPEGRTNALANLALGEAYLVAGNPTEAIESFRRARPGPPWSHLSLRMGDAYLTLGKTNEAVAEFDRHHTPALERINAGTASAELLNNLAWFNVQRGIKPTESLELAQRAVAQKPETRIYQDTLGWAYLRNGRHREALEVFGMVIAAKSPAMDTSSASSWKGLVATAASDVEPDVFTNYVHEALQQWSTNDAMRALLRVAAALFFDQRGQAARAREYRNQAGFIEEDRWIFVGPFPNPRGEGFARAFLPEESTSVDLSAAYEGLSGRVSWHKASDGLNDGFVDLGRIFGPNLDWVTAYAWTSFESAMERSVWLRFGSDDQARVWLNGREVVTVSGPRTAGPDQNIVPVRLRAGQNSLLVKVFEERVDWGFYLRFTDAEGLPYLDLK